MNRNLVIAIEPAFHGLDDFIAIAERVQQSNPKIRVHIISTREAWADADPRWQSPTLVVALSPPENFKLKRGRLFSNQNISKLVQAEILSKHRLGLPTIPFRYGMALDAAQWGAFTILKQLSKVPFRRRVFRLLPTHRVPLLTPQDIQALNFPTDDLIVQPFVDTGIQPSTYRVLIFFGKAISAVRQTLPIERPPLDASTPEAALADASIAIVESGVAGKAGVAPVCELIADADVIGLAERAARLWPLHPTFGVDIVRDMAGKLHVIEMNGGGNSWHFSSQIAATGVRASLSRSQLLAQFQALDLVADKLAELTLRHAR